MKSKLCYEVALCMKFSTATSLHAANRKLGYFFLNLLDASEVSDSEAPRNR